MHDNKASRLQATFSISRQSRSKQQETKGRSSIAWRFIFPEGEGGGEEVERRLARMRDFALSGKGELIARINRSEISHVRYENAQRSRARSRNTVTRSELPRVPCIYDDGGTDTCDRSSKNRNERPFVAINA